MANYCNVAVVILQMLITEAVQFESWTSTVALKNERGLQPVTLRGRPQGAGELQITGYSTTISGVTSNCRFKFLPHLRTPQYTINVVPALPMIQVSMSMVSGLISGLGTRHLANIEFAVSQKLSLT